MQVSCAKHLIAATVRSSHPYSHAWDSNKSNDIKYNIIKEYHIIPKIIVIYITHALDEVCIFGKNPTDGVETPGEIECITEPSAHSDSHDLWCWSHEDLVAPEQLSNPAGGHG